MIDNSHVSKVLGQVVEYPQFYDKSVLVREPRQNNRTHLGIDNNNLPFSGYDVWNAYEVSWLTPNGMPMAGVLQLVYDASSEYIVESKSLKLYLNSFNMQTLQSHDEFVNTVTKDLSELLNTSVQCNVYIGDEYNNSVSNIFESSTFKQYVTLETAVDTSGMKFTVYSETPSLLNVHESVEPYQMVGQWHSSLLKSNCRVTKQPDWGDVWIRWQWSDKVIDAESLLQYIVSFRDECHFHEEICETIFIRLYQLLKPVDLQVMCNYTRRGGIDINPVRYIKHDFHANGNAIRIQLPWGKTARQ